MRIDKEGNQRTLEQDIQEIWKLHGWDIIEERVSGNTWKITAKANPSKHSLSSSKKDCLKCGGVMTYNNRTGLYYCDNLDCGNCSPS